MTQELKSDLLCKTLALSRHTKHMAIGAQFCFNGCFLPTLSNHEGAYSTELVNQISEQH